MNLLANSRLMAACTAILLVAAALPGTVAAGTTGTTFNVTKFADTADGDCSLEDCSLREAIIAANASADVDQVNVPAGRYVLSITGIDENLAATGDLDILSGIEIRGAGARKTIIDGGGIDRVFHVPQTSPAVPFTILIQGVTITGGVIENAIGGGIWTQEPMGTLHLLQSTVRGNRANQAGGVANGYTSETTMIIERSTISGNRAPGSQGGGIVNVGDLTIINSTVSGNKSGAAGGILQFQGTLNIQFSTIAFNVALGSGGGIVVYSGTVTIESSIVAKNTSAFAFSRNCSGAITSAGHNLENGDTCGFNQASDVRGNPQLDALGYYGGPTKTHRLLAGSPAINAGGPVFPATDQRGVNRPRGAAADIGAYER